MKSLAVVESGMNGASGIVVLGLLQVGVRNLDGSCPPAEFDHTSQSMVVV